MKTAIRSRPMGESFTEADVESIALELRVPKESVRFRHSSQLSAGSHTYTGTLMDDPVPDELGEIRKASPM